MLLILLEYSSCNSVVLFIVVGSLTLSGVGYLMLRHCNKLWTQKALELLLVLLLLSLVFHSVTLEGPVLNFPFWAAVYADPPPTLLETSRANSRCRFEQEKI